jgi:uncharacterized protein
MSEQCHRPTPSDLSRHQAYADRGPQRVAITGASGLIGSNLAAFLSTGGHDVHPLVRREPRPESGELRWDPARGEIDAAGLEAFDVLVHLAGKGVAEDRWNDRVKREIMESRVEGTRLISRALAGLEQPPRVLIAASAVGYYGDRGDEVLTEENGAGSGFLSEVCQAWEAAAEPARLAGIRVVHLRVGIVLSPQGGVLARILPLFKSGAAGPLGGGRQWLSWIALDDILGAILHLMFAEGLSGPVNGTAPNPVTNREFTHVLAALLKRPAAIPAPAFALKMAMGPEMAEELLLTSERVLPHRLEQSGFRFLHPGLEEALRFELGQSVVSGQ